MACAATVWAASRLQTDAWPWSVSSDRDLRLVVASALVVAAAAAMARWYGRTALGARITPTPLWLGAVWRAACFATLVIGIAVVFPNGQAGAAVILGVLIGADLTLTLWALGLPGGRRMLLRRFASSPVHLGAIGAALAVLVAGTGPDPRTLGTLYLGVLVALAGTLAAVRVLQSLAVHFEQEFEAHRNDVAARERAHRAHWLHDDVLSEVRLASLRIANGTASVEHINAELLDLDHRLRLRQLEELIRDGTPPAYEVLQPHLRRAQSLGIRLGAVPTHEVTRTVLSEGEATLFNRVLSLLMSNAMNAGASEISVAMRLLVGAIEVSVTDDAGGFDLDAVPEGRGLHRLIVQLGPDAVRRTATSSGSTVTVRLVHTMSDSADLRAPADHRVLRPVVGRLS